MRNYPIKISLDLFEREILSFISPSLQLSHRVKIITLSIVELKKKKEVRLAAHRFDSTCRAPLIKLAASQRVGEIIRRVLFLLVSKKFNLLRERERMCARARAYTHTHFIYFYSARFVPRVNFLKETVAPSNKRIEFPALPFAVPIKFYFVCIYIYFSSSTRFVV